MNVKLKSVKSNKHFYFGESRCASLERITIIISFVDLDIICDRVDVVFANFPFLAELNLHDKYDLHINHISNFLWCNRLNIRLSLIWKQGQTYVEWKIQDHI